MKKSSCSFSIEAGKVWALDLHMDPQGQGRTGQEREGSPHQQGAPRSLWGSGESLQRGRQGRSRDQEETHRELRAELQGKAHWGRVLWVLLALRGRVRRGRVQGLQAAVPGPPRAGNVVETVPGPLGWRGTVRELRGGTVLALLVLGEEGIPRAPRGGRGTDLTEPRDQSRARQTLPEPVRGPPGQSQASPGLKEGERRGLCSRSFWPLSECRLLKRRPTRSLP